MSHFSFFAFITRKCGQLALWLTTKMIIVLEKGRYLPQMGMTRGLIAMLERVRNQGIGLRPLSTPIVGHGRAKARALLLEVITRNPAQGLNQVPFKQGGEEVWDLLLLLAPIPHLHLILLVSKKPGVEPLALISIWKPLVCLQFISLIFAPPRRFSLAPHL